MKLSLKPDIPPAPEQPEGCELAALTAEPPEKLASYVRMCARTTELLPGAFAIQRRSSRALETIERNARAQGQLIEELLDISRIITGKMRLNVQQLDPIHVVQSALEAIRPAAEAKNVRLQAVLDPQAGPIMGDPDRLQQICWNLLSNAVKFNPQGGAHPGGPGADRLEH